MHPYIQITSEFRIPSYGIMMMLGLFAASALGLVRVHKAGLRWESAVVLIACGFGFGILGSTVLYVIVSYNWSELIELLCSGALFTEEKLGLVFYGGFLAAIPGVLFGARLTKAHLRDYVPAMVPCIPFGHAFGRIGCLMAGCCYGIPTSLPIGVVYHNPISDAPDGVALFPVQALESLLLLVIFVMLIAYTKKRRTPVRIVGLYFMLYAVCRFCLEYLRYDAIRGHVAFWSTSQWISILMLLVGSGLCLRGRKYLNFV